MLNRWLIPLRHRWIFFGVFIFVAGRGAFAMKGYPYLLSPLITNEGMLKTVEKKHVAYMLNRRLNPLSRGWGLVISLTAMSGGGG